MQKIQESASDLYREMKRKGIHLRKGNGRDDKLLSELCDKLGDTEYSLQAFLDGSSLTAQDFLLEFLTLAEPFAQMFQDIWHYVSSNKAVNALESVSVRFGFEYENDKAIDLEQFRRYAQSSEKIISLVKSRIWSTNAMCNLFDLAELLNDNFPPGKVDYYANPNVKLPLIHPGTHPVDGVIREVRDLFQRILNEKYKQEVVRKRDLSLIDNFDDGNSGIRSAIYFLADLLPGWARIFSNAENIPEAKKDEGYTFYKEEIERMIEWEEEEQEINGEEALDILDMPFWKHRWHTYEVWCTVSVLKIMHEYQPALRIVNGRIPIDGFTEEIIADLKTTDHPHACIIAQSQTPFTSGKKVAIKPDLRICFDAQPVPDSTAAVVEYKQQKQMTAKYIEDISVRYTEGVPKSGGALIINYDQIDIKPNLAAKSKLVQQVHPGAPDKVIEVKDELLAILKSVHFLPVKNTGILLFDVSESMQSLYKDDEFQKLKPALHDMKHVKIYFFSDGLVQGGDLIQKGKRFSAFGGTQLRKALTELKQICVTLEQVLIVTDGYHGNPWELKEIPRLKECLPRDLSANLEWLLSGH